MASDLDIALQTLWQKSPATFLQQAGLGPVTIVRFGHRTQPLVKERELDGALILKDADQSEFIAHAEFESQPEKAEIPFRVFQYGSLLHIAHRLPVRSFLFLVNENVWVDDFYEVKNGGKTLRYEFTIIRIFAQAAASLAADPLLAALTPLARDVKPADLDRAYQTLHVHTPQAQLADLVAVLYILVRSKKMSMGSSFEQELRQWARTSPIFAELFPELFTEGEAKGEAKGMAKGKTEGKAEGLQSSILRHLKHRFPRTTWDAKNLDGLSIAALEQLDEGLWTVKDVRGVRALIQQIRKDNAAG